MEFITLNRDSFQKYMKEFADLYTLCFNVPMDANEVAWRYLENPNQEILACIAVENGKLVANYSASPIKLVKNDHIIKAALSLNTMTHPDYMGQGLFVKLASSVYNHMFENGYRLIMGFPNNISNRTFIGKLGWRDICTVPTMQLDLSMARMPVKTENVNIVQDDEFLLDYTKCDRHENAISVYKPKEYLQWRYYKNPAMKYYNFVVEKNGYTSSRIIVKDFRDRINIVDSYFSDDNEMKALINKAIEFGKEKEKHCITMWSKLNSWQHLVLEGYGFTITAPVTYFGANVFDEHDDYADYYGENQWVINMSDDNVY